MSKKRVFHPPPDHVKSRKDDRELPSSPPTPASEGGKTNSNKKSISLGTLPLWQRLLFSAILTTALIATILVLCSPSEETPVSEVGKTRANPVPLGSSLQYGDMELTVLWFERQAYTLSSSIMAGWPCVPSQGKEYAVATIGLRNLGSPDGTQNYYTIDFRMVGSEGTIYDNTGCDNGNLLESGELFGGGAASGDIICEVAQADTNLVLIWSADWGVSQYFSLE